MNIEQMKTAYTIWRKALKEKAESAMAQVQADTERKEQNNQLKASARVAVWTLAQMSVHIENEAKFKEAHLEHNSEVMARLTKLLVEANEVTKELK